jgi:hypothetical protein
MTEQSSYERFIPTLPLLGAVIAVTFDVGYFWGVDINYFNFFSLSEHLIFAVQALPFAMILALLILLMDSVSEWQLNRLVPSRMSNANRTSIPELEKEIGVLSKSARRSRIVLYASAVVVIPIFWYLTSYRMLVLVCTMMILHFTSRLAQRAWYSSSISGIACDGNSNVSLIW